MRPGEANPLVLWMAATIAAATARKAREDSSEGLKKMTFKAPDLNAEESHGRFLPDHLKCDACQAIAHQVNKTYITRFLSGSEDCRLCYKSSANYRGMPSSLIFLPSPLDADTIG